MPDVTATESRTKRDALREAVRVAAEAFTTRPWRDISMHEIAREAKCSLSTLYNAFGGKDEFVLYAVSHALQVSLPDLGASDHDARRPEVLLWLNLYAHARFVAADSTRQSFANLASLPSSAVEARRHYHERITKFCGQVAELVRNGQRAGALRPCDADAAGVNLLARSGWQLALWPLVLGDLVQGTPDLEVLTDEALAPYLTEVGAASMAQWRTSRP